MTITQLEYIIAVRTHGSFSEAASKCLVTQPTLSMQIQKLESELEVIIFRRDKFPINPSDKEILKVIPEEFKQNKKGLVIH